jgi:hypothetical protein
MPNRFLILTLIVIVTVIGGCAKRNTAYQPDDEWLSLDKQIPVVGDPLDLCFDDDYIFVAQDQGGMSSIRRSDYQHKWYTFIKAIDGSVFNLVKIRRIDTVNQHKRLFINEIGDTDRIYSIDTSEADTLHFVSLTIGSTVGITDMDFRAATTAGSIYTIEGGYCQAGKMIVTNYNDDFGLVNDPAIIPPGSASGFCLSNNYIYIAAQQRGLAIYNRSNQQLVKEFAIPGSALKVSVVGNLAFIASRQGGLSIVNVADPVNPILLSSFPTSNFTTTVNVAGNKAAISAGSGGVYLFDITNPAQPVLLQRLTSCGYANSAKFMGNKLLVAGRDQGILIYSIK